MVGSSCLVAALAGVCFGQQGVRVVAANAGVGRSRVLELTDVFLVFVFVYTLGIGTEERGASRKVVYISEAQLVTDGIWINPGDGLVDRHGRFTTLVAFETQVRIVLVPEA